MRKLHAPRPSLTAHSPKATTLQWLLLIHQHMSEGRIASSRRLGGEQVVALLRRRTRSCQLVNGTISYQKVTEIVVEECLSIW
ncbi:hypothetical protein DL98DRAFT_522237 [Cadophora sp. DSE1049]|nr:hypothetical protein DL98DRAFT_522237 [Cadophora sp. DSE1049]